MPIPINIENLLDGNIVESSRLEFKEGWNPEAVIHTVCAFANDIDDCGGGYIIIGAAEDNGMLRRPITGLDSQQLDKMQKELLNLCHHLKPEYMPICEPVFYEGTWLLIIWVPGGYDRPYSAPASLNNKRAEKAHYVRRFSNTVKANNAEKRDLYEMGGRVPFDDRINYRSTIADLERSYMEDYLHAVGSSIENIESLNTLETARALRVIGGPTENERPLNAGLLMFSADPEKFLPHARIEVVDIPDPTGEGMTERVFKGPINRQLSDALTFIRNYVVAERVFKIPGQAEAVRAFNYPYEAIEEALSNAVLHRGYNEYEPITVRVEPGQMSILSVPGPDRSISDEDIKNKKLISKRYRNRRIGEFLKELNLIEGRNTGIPTMLRAMKANGSEPPLFATDDDRTYFEVIFKENPLFESSRKVEPELTTSQLNNKLTRRSREEIRYAVLDLLSEQDLSQTELAIKLGYKGRSKTLREVIDGLLNEKTLSLTGPAYSPKTKLHKEK